MHRTALLFATIIYLLMAAVCYFMATRAVNYIESATAAEVSTALTASGHDWATLGTDGLEVRLTGLAPTEAARFRALEVIGEVVDTSRIVDRTRVLETSGVKAPRFSLEILRNEDRISLIGLVPLTMGRKDILETVRDIDQVETVTDMLESADHPLPEGWIEAVNFGLESLRTLPRSKISVASDRVKIIAVTDSPEQQNKVQTSLATAKPDSVKLELDISAPRPVISPFRYRVILDDGKVQVTSCSADTVESRNRITSALAQIGSVGKVDCAIGLGVPTTDWARALSIATTTLGEIGGGTLTFADTDVSLVVPSSMSQTDFDAVTGELDARLPELFALNATLPPREVTANGDGLPSAPEFIATRSPEGIVQLRGRVPNEVTKTAVGTYALALFGSDTVYNTTRLDPTLPDGWPSRVLAGLDGLAALNRGSVIVQPDSLALKGVGGREELPSELDRLFVDRLGADARYTVDVSYDPAAVAANETVRPEDCALQVNAVLASQKIEFAPSSATIEARSQGIIDAIAEVIAQCPDAEFEVAGFTDSQGREEMNQNLSSARAQAVVTALINANVFGVKLTAKGYGEADPIATNDTEEGRAQNRRIEFKLIQEETGDE